MVEEFARRFVPGGRDGWSAVGVDEFLRAYLQPRGRAAFYAALRNIYLDEPEGEEGFWTRLRSLERDSLFVWGRNDRLVPIAFARHVREALPAAQHLELECGHVPQLEAPKETHAAVRRFLAARAAVRRLEWRPRAFAAGAGRTSTAAGEGVGGSGRGGGLRPGVRVGRLWSDYATQVTTPSAKAVDSAETPLPLRASPQCAVERPRARPTRRVRVTRRPSFSRIRALIRTRPRPTRTTRLNGRRRSRATRLRPR